MGVPLGILAALASAFALSWAQDFLVPLLFGIVIAYTLNPLVGWLEAIRIPRGIGTVIVMASVIGALVFGTYSLRGQMQTIIKQLPDAANQFADGLKRLQISQVGAMQIMQNAATKVETATTQVVGGAAPASQQITHVVIDQPTFKLSHFLWGNSLDAHRRDAQASMVAFLVFFLLLGGDTFKRKLVRLTGPSLSKRKITVHILDDINGSIQKYMLMMLTTNLLVGLLSWIAFRLIGLENAGAWARPQAYSTSCRISAGRHGHRDGNGGVHAVRVVRHGITRCRRIARDRNRHRHADNDVDDRAHRQHEFSGRIHFAAVLGLAVGRLGNAAQHPDHRHRQSRVATCRQLNPVAELLGD